MPFSNFTELARKAKKGIKIGTEFLKEQDEQGGVELIEGDLFGLSEDENKVIFGDNTPKWDTDISVHDLFGDEAMTGDGQTLILTPFEPDKKIDKFETIQQLPENEAIKIKKQDEETYRQISREMAKKELSKKWGFVDIDTFQKNPSAFLRSKRNKNFSENLRLPEEKQIEEIIKSPEIREKIKKQQQTSYIQTFLKKAETCLTESLGKITGKKITAWDERINRFSEGLKRGITLGVAGDKFVYEVQAGKDILKIPDYGERLSPTEARIIDFVSEVVGSIPAYSIGAQMIKSVTLLSKTATSFANTYPKIFRFGMLPMNEELAEYGIRKISGQEYGINNLIAGMAGNFVFESVFGKQINRYLTKNEKKIIFKSVENITPDSISYSDFNRIFREQGIIFLKEKYGESIFKEGRLAEFKALGEEEKALIVYEGKKFDPIAYMNENFKKREAARKADKGDIGRIQNVVEELKTVFVDANARLDDRLATHAKKYQYSLLPSANIHDQIDMVYRAPALADEFIQRSKLPRVLQTVDNIDHFDDYLVARQAIDLNIKGFETGRNIEKDKLLLAAVGNKYEESAKAVTEFSHHLLDYCVESDLIDADLAKKLKEIYPNYIPMNRIFNELEKSGKFFGGKSVASLSKQNIVQKLVGSKREIESPTGSLIEKTLAAFVQGEKNKAAKMINAYKNLPNNPFKLEPLRTKSDYDKRISIFSDLKESKKIKNDLLKIVKKSKKEINILNKELSNIKYEGKKLLKKKYKESETIAKTKDFDPLSVSLSQDDLKIKFLDEFLQSKDFLKLKKQLVAKNEKLAPFLDSLEKTSLELEILNQARRAKYDKALAFSDTKAGQKSTMNFLNQGFKEIWGIDPDIARVVKVLKIQQFGVIGRVLTLPVRIAKLGITGINPAFAMANFVKDQFTAIAFSDATMRTINPVNYVESIFATFQKNDLYRDMVRHGGGGTFFDTSRNVGRKTVESIRAEKNLLSKIKHKITTPKEWLSTVENVIGFTEEATRVNQFNVTKKMLLSQGRTLKDANILAARAAREVTVNFYRRGEWGTVINGGWLYLNAGIQGGRTLARNLKNKPKITSLKILTSLYTPLAIATMWNLKDPLRKIAYEDIEEWEKENNIIIVPPNPQKDENGKWNILKIPIPQGLNSLTFPVRRGIEEGYGLHPLTMKEIASSFIGAVSPLEATTSSLGSALIPQIIKPSVESLAGYDFFREKKLLSEYKEKLDPELQSYKSTSETAKKIAVILGEKGVAPVKVEHLLKQTFGEVGLLGLRAADTLLAELGAIPDDHLGGRGLAESIMRRFTKAYGGKTERLEIEETEKYERKSLSTAKREKDRAKKIFAKLSEFPEFYKEREMEKIKEKDENLYEKIKEVEEKEEKKMSYSEMRIKGLPIYNKTRAKRIYEIFKDLPKKEKQTKFEDFKKKGIITKEIWNQILELAKKTE